MDSEVASLFVKKMFLKVLWKWLQFHTVGHQQVVYAAEVTADRASSVSVPVEDYKSHSKTAHNSKNNSTIHT